MDNFKNVLFKGAQQFGVNLTDKQLNEFYLYWQMLVEWNEKFNLTAIVEANEVIVKHFLDSLSTLKAMDLKPGMSVLDVGTGAGFPGIPLLIYEPKIKLTLLDSLQKRTVFLLEVIKKLGYSENVEVVHGRAEDFGSNIKFREKFDVVLTRAVSKVPVIAEYCLPFVKIGGSFIAMKGPGAEEEISISKNAISILGGTDPNVLKIVLPFQGDTRFLLNYKKVKSTPKNYPRKAGIPTKKPLV